MKKVYTVYIMVNPLLKCATVYTLYVCIICILLKTFASVRAVTSYYETNGTHRYIMVNPWLKYATVYTLCIYTSLLFYWKY